MMTQTQQTDPVVEIDGILLVDKPEGLSSAAVVAVVRRSLGGRVKVGHLGTLDPFASGLLPLCLGEGTKAAQFLHLADKSYTGAVRLGVTTDTLDRTGRVLCTQVPPSLPRAELERIAAQFRGSIEQVPPAFSAIKRDGVPMYRLARRGGAPALEPRRVQIHALELRDAGEGRLALRVACSKGTYIRSLARDIGERAGCGAMLEELRRTSFGRFRVEEAVALEVLREPQGRAAALARIIPVGEALAELPAFEVDEATAARLRTGQQEPLRGLPAPSDLEEQTLPEWARAEDRPPAGRILCSRRLVAVVSWSGAAWRLCRIFA